MKDEGKIVIKGANVNNLKNVSVEIPRNKFIVITGISGSGKSSLAFDTLFAEGQRRFAESLSSYARQFLGRMTKPNVELIEGIPPAIAIEQKVNTRNPRSTVATTTEIYDYLRILFARIGHTFSPISGQEVKRHQVSDVLNYIFAGNPQTIYLLADIKWQEREDKVELMLSLKEQGYSRFWSGKEIIRIEQVMQNAQTGDYPEDLFLLIDRGRPASENASDLRSRLNSSIESAFSIGNGIIYVIKDGESKQFISRFEADGMEFCIPDEYMFSFNSPLGACPVCGGLGKIVGISEDLVIPDKSKSIYDDAITCWKGEKMVWFKEQLIKVAEKYDIPLFTPYAQLSEKTKDLIWNARSIEGDGSTFVGINEFFEWVDKNKYKIQFKYLLSRFSGKAICHECKGSRIRKDALYVRIGGKNIHELMSMTVEELLLFFNNLKLSENEVKIAQKAIEEICSRLQCINDVGLSYLTLNRTCNSLSGGESQRINLVTALGSSLIGSMYILDEPSIGLHPRDTQRLIDVLKRLRDIGNTVIVVEHDEEIIRSADVLIDIGPKAGCDGGEIVYNGSSDHGPSLDEIAKSLTLQYLTGGRPRFTREKRIPSYWIKVEGAMEHNLKNINVKFPLGVLTVVTGVSGSGKSSLVGDILYPALYRTLNQTGKQPGTFSALSGNLDRISMVEYVDQNPIGKNSRSNAVTYLKIYDDIRKLMAKGQYAKLNGYTPSFFSFNQEGGRCSECQGEGFVRIGMQFMADVTMVCESCGGKRFKPDILEVKYKDKNIDDILNMSVIEAVEFFGQQTETEAKSIAHKLQTLIDVGLQYIKLGQSSSTLSGGESQRIKLAYFLSLSNAEETGRKRMLFIFDEPTTGLHFYDIEKLIKAFDVLLKRGHSIIVVEHNLDVIRSADWIIDLGPEAGDKGGQVVFEGTPEEMRTTAATHTANWLK